ncbi:MAG: hypothetical protein RSC43_00425 [Clostridia bacterium]
MIYTAQSLFFQGKSMVLGYTRENGVHVLIDDLFNSRLAFAELCKQLGGQPELNSTKLEDGSIFVELDITFKPTEGHHIENIFKDTTEEDNVFIQPVMSFPERFDVLHFNSNFERVGALVPEIIQKLQPKDFRRQARMNSPEDELSFSVPTYAELKAVYGETKLPDIDEETGEVEEAIGDAEQKTSEFTDASLVQAVELVPSFDSLNPEINFETIPVRRQFQWIDSIEFEDALRLAGNPIPTSYITGNPQNNMLPIQNNEKDYYVQLIDLVKEGIMIENGVVTENEVEELMRQGKRSVIVDKYLEDLAGMAFAVNWTHTGTVLNSVESESADDDSEDSQGNVDIGVIYPGYYRVDMVNGKVAKTYLVNICQDRISKGTFIEGITRIRNYCNRQVFNSYAWVETLIRLLRWGDRKPSCLCVKSFDKSKPIYLDLNSLNLTPFAGNVEDLVPVMVDVENDISRYIFGIALTPTNGFSNPSIIDEMLGISVTADTRIPVGILLRTDYVDQEVFKLDLLDIETFVSMIAADAIKLKGVTFDKSTNKFSITQEAESRIEGMFDIDEVLSGNIPNVIIERIQNPGIVRTLQIISERFKDVRLQEVNTFTIMSEFFHLENSSTVYAANELINISKEDERNAALSRLKSETGYMAGRIVKMGLIEQVCLPYMDLYALVGSEPELESMLNDMFGIMTSKKTNAVRKPKIELKINPKFTAFVQTCTRYFTLNDMATQEVICYIGELTKEHKDIAGKPTAINFYFFWSPKEYNYVPKTPTALTAANFIKAFLVPYDRNREALVDKRFFSATTNTISDVYVTLKKATANK